MNEARKPKEITPLEELQRLDPNTLAQIYQEDDDERVLPLLIDYFAAGSWRSVVQISQRLNGDIPPEDIRDEVVQDTIMACLEHHDPNREANFKTYTFRALNFNLQKFYKSKTAGIRNVKLKVYINKPVGEDGNTELEDLLPNPKALDEDGLAEEQIRTLTHEAIEAIAAIALKPREREAHTQFMETESKTDVGAKLEVSAERGRQIVEKIKSKIKKILNELSVEESEELIEAKLIVFKYLVPELAHLEYEGLEQLEEIGIKFSNTAPYVQINSADVEKFNTAIFELEDGTYISGYEILFERNAESVRDLFIGEKIDPEKMLLPLSQTHAISHKSDITSENLPALLKTKENLDAFQELFAAYVTEDGKWHVTIKVNDFVRKWIKLPNGKGISGRTILNLLGLQKSKEDLRQIAEIIFGEEIEFTNIRIVDHNSMEVIGKKRFIQELQSKKNISKLKKLGIKLEGDKCHATIKVTDLYEHLFVIRGKTRHARNVFDDLGFELMQEFIVPFLELIFPGYKILYWREKNNGHLIELTDTEEVLEELQTEENKQALLALTKKYPNGQRKLLDPRRKNYGAPFTIKGKKKGIQGVCEALDIPTTKKALLPYYQQIFGDKTIVIEIPREEVVRQMKFKRNQAALKQFCTQDPNRKLSCNTPITDIKRKIFKIDGITMGVQAILNRLNLPKTKAGLNTLCEIVFEQTT